MSPRAALAPGPIAGRDHQIVGEQGCHCRSGAVATAVQPRRDSLPGKFAGSRGEADDPVSWSDRTPRLHVEAGVLALTGQIWVVVGIMVDDVPPMLP